MKKYVPTYSSDYIIYWPSFAGGVGLLCFCGMVLFLYFSCIILFLSDHNIANNTMFGVTIVGLMVLVWLIMTVRMIVKTMFCCITITRRNFSIVNRVTTLHTNILWEQVSHIEFHQEGYRGQKQYRVYLKVTPQTQYIAIPISIVNEEKLLSIIPSELLINNQYRI